MDARVGDQRRAHVALAREQVERAGGTPAAWNASTIASAQPGDCSAGLSTTPLPVARPAATMPAGIASGKFHGADDGDDAAGRVAEGVALAGELDEPVAGLQRDRLSA